MRALFRSLDCRVEWGYRDQHCQEDRGASPSVVVAPAGFLGR